MKFTTKLSAMFPDVDKYGIPLFTVGMPVVDSNGKTVGTITEIDLEYDILVIDSTDVVVPGEI